MSEFSSGRGKKRRMSRLLLAASLLTTGLCETSEEEDLFSPEDTSSSSLDMSSSISTSPGGANQDFGRRELLATLLGHFIRFHDRSGHDSCRVILFYFLGGGVKISQNYAKFFYGLGTNTIVKIQNRFSLQKLIGTAIVSVRCR